MYKDSMGRYMTQGLFFEMTSPADRKKFNPPYTLKDYDYEVNGVLYKSMRAVYVDLSDPTEYQPAMELLGSWDHWNKLLELPWFREHRDKWKQEVEMKLKSLGLRAVIKTARGDGASAASAAKFLVDQGWVQGKKGRPSKETIRKEANKLKQYDKDLHDDIKRLEVDLH